MKAAAPRKFHVKRGDTVVVLSGEAAGKTGKVKEILPRTNRALVEGLNLVKRHMRKSQKNPQGGILEIEAPIALSNLRRQDGAAKKQG